MRPFFRASTLSLLRLILASLSKNISEVVGLAQGADSQLFQHCILFLRGNLLETRQELQKVSYKIRHSQLLLPGKRESSIAPTFWVSEESLTTLFAGVALAIKNTCKLSALRHVQLIPFPDFMLRVDGQRLFCPHPEAIIGGNAMTFPRVFLGDKLEDPHSFTRLRNLLLFAQAFFCLLHVTIFQCNVAAGFRL
jgi:hypothetical protein